jgi:hypothetical protein
VWLSWKLIEPESDEGLVAGFAAAMQKLLDQPELANSRGSPAANRATRAFNWQGKVDQVICIYRALAEKSDVLRVAEQTIPGTGVSGRRGTQINRARMIPMTTHLSQKFKNS